MKLFNFSNTYVITKILIFGAILYSSVRADWPSVAVQILLSILISRLLITQHIFIERGMKEQMKQDMELFVEKCKDAKKQLLQDMKTTLEQIGLNARQCGEDGLVISNDPDYPDCDKPWLKPHDEKPKLHTAHVPGRPARPGECPCCGGKNIENGKCKDCGGLA